MAQLTIRIPDQLRRQMRRMREFNWSEVIRQAVQAKIDLETRKRPIRNRRLVIQAVKKQDSIADSLATRYNGAWDGVEVIRYWRSHRYSSSTHQ